ncbi:lysosomal Pro-X carboxypeptidase, partial [Fagus crenata]
DASLNCFEVIKGSWAELEALSAQKGGLDWLWSAFTYTAMVNYPMKANFLMPLPAYPGKQMCNIIDGFPPGASKLSRVFLAASLYYNYSRTEKCFNLENQPDAHGVRG